MRFPGINGEVDIVWYFTDRGFLPFSTIYNSRNWLTEGIRPDNRPGEVRGAKRFYSKGRNPKEDCDGIKGTSLQWAGEPGPLWQCVPRPLAKGGAQVSGFGSHRIEDRWQSQGTGIRLGVVGRFGTGWTGSVGLRYGVYGIPGSGWPGQAGLLYGPSGPFAQGFEGFAGLEYGTPGDFPTPVSDVPIGAIYWWPNTTPPADHLYCNGQAVSRTTYAALFAICGTTFGAGDGSTTFNVPNLRGQSALGHGTSPSGFNRVLGTASGTEQVQLTTAQLPPHTHAQATNTMLSTGGSAFGLGIAGPPGQFGGTTGSTGGNTAHNNMHPYLVLLPIIKAL